MGPPRLGLRTTFALALLLPAIAGDLPQLPHCGKRKPSSPSLVFVSTLDGQVTAIDTREGQEKWSFNTGSPLLSSSIHRLELTNGGQWMRLVPSLSGSLYRFSGDALEPLPITADQLLSSSYKYSDDLVVAGAKESTSFGVSTQTGQVTYECSISGCINNTVSLKGLKNKIPGDDAGDEDSGEILLIRRVAQTVRAFEPRSGQEKWNFSVGQHELSLQPFEGCILPPILDTPEVEIVYKVIVPEGLICAVDKNSPHRIIWKHKFNSPVVSAWRVEGSQLNPIDLFGVPHLPHINKDFEKPNPFISPAVYIGMHDRQLYVQESVRMQTLVQSARKHYIGSPQDNKQSLVMPWRPISAQALTEWNSDSTALSGITEKDYSATALSVLYASEYVNGNGYYLYIENDRKILDDPTCNTPKIDQENHSVKEIMEAELINGDNDSFDWGDSQQITILVVSLSYWWKEVVLIAIGTALCYNYLFNKIIGRALGREVIHTVVIERAESTPPDLLNPYPPVANQLDTVPPPFVSRYLNDFTPVKCLGRGGFGVVFEAKNKIDDANYAIKRITLPNKKEKRDRLLREVRALAKLEHNNIVRYFNSWLEEPPIGWEDPYEKEFNSNEEYTGTYSKGTSQVNTVSNVNDSVFTKKIESASRALSGTTISIDEGYDAIVDIPFRNRSYSVNDSYIVFGSKDSSSSYSHVNKDDLSCNTTKSDHNSLDEVDGNDRINENVESVINIDMDDPVSLIKTAWEIVNESNNTKQKRKHRRNLSLDLRKQTFEKSKADVPVSKMYLYIQMQLCQEKSLREWLRENTDAKIRQTQFVVIFEQIVSAVEYVHLQGLIHRDLKPSNIFFSVEGQIKVGDFGLVTTMADPLSADQGRAVGSFEVSGEKHTQHVGTHLYMSPEQLRGEAHNFKVDIWSLGLVLMELLVPFQTEMERITVLKALRDNRYPPEFNAKYPNEHSLLQLMLSPNPNKRPTTLGVRARPPLSHSTELQYHFCLPPRLPRSTSSSVSY